MSDILEAALHYAEVLGWSVFPSLIIPNGPKLSYLGAPKPDKLAHPLYNGRNWGSTRDPDLIRKMYEAFPYAGVGIVCGAESNGLLVVDVDTKQTHAHNGADSLAELEATHGKLPTTLQALTPGMGRHIYLRVRAGVEVISLNGFKPGVDIKCDRGMVIAAPSVHPAGGSYAWDVLEQVAEAPQWLIDEIEAARTANKKKGSVDPQLLETLELPHEPTSHAERILMNEYPGLAASLSGDRNARLNQAAWRAGMYFRELPQDFATEILLKACAVNGVLKDDGEAVCRSTIASGWKSGTKAPKKTAQEMFPPELVGPAQAEAVAQAAAAGLLTPPKGIRPRRIEAASLHGSAIPERKWLVPGLIPARNVTLLYGDGGTGKSLLALMLGTCIVSGFPFFSRPVQQGRVEFITAEDETDELHRRLVDIARSRSKNLDAFAGLHITSLAEEDALLAVPEEGRRGAGLVSTPLYDELEKILKESRPSLLVLDTLADIYGGDEVIRHQVRQFVGKLRKLAVGCDCTVIVLAHPSLSGMDKGTSGSTAWNNSVRSRLFFTRMLDTDGTEPDEDLRVLKVGKLNYGRVGVEIPMRWKAGVFVEEGGTSGPDPLTQSWKAERVFLDMLDRANKQNTHVSGSRNAPNYAPKVFASDALKQGVRKRDLVDAMQRLFDAEKIENAQYGPPSRITHRLQRTFRLDVVAPPLAPVSTGT